MTRARTTQDHRDREEQIRWLEAQVEALRRELARVREEQAR